MLIRTNTGLVRRLLVPMIGKEDLMSKGIRPQLHQAFKWLMQEQNAPVDRGDDCGDWEPR